jgi:hypothetical protein
MKEIEENEDKIISKVILNKDGKVDGDENMYRVYWLIEQSLIFIAYSKENSGWETLFFEPNTKTYWERVFLNGDMQGGGPPSLLKIAEEDAHNKYEF